ncbi:DUF4132 domain-containing protein [Spirillospora sp. CA-253888]
MTDENALVLPAAWRAHLHPRRGGVQAAPVEIDASAVAALEATVRAEHEHIGRVLGRADGDPGLVARTRAYLAGDPDPVGAAGLAVLLAGWDDGAEARTAGIERCCDAWAAGHGPVFAAAALVEMAGIAQVWRGRTWLRNRDPFSLRHVDPGDRLGGWWLSRSAARRVRALVAGAGEEEYRAAAERLAGMRDTPLRRAVVSYLLADRRDWLDECCAEAAGGHHEGLLQWMLWCSASTPEQAAALAAAGRFGQYELQIDVLASAVEGLGTAFAPHAAAALRSPYTGADERGMLLDALAMLPSDEAFGLLLERADEKHVQTTLQAVAERFPARALRLLAADAGTGGRGNGRRATVLNDLLTAHMLARPALVAEMLPGLPEHARRAVEAVRAATARGPEAAEADLPGLLVSPPWTRRRSAAKPVVLPGLVPPAGVVPAWADGERETWAEPPYQAPVPPDVDWAAEVATLGTPLESRNTQSRVLFNAPEDLVRPLLETWTPKGLWLLQGWLPGVAARFGADALPLLLRMARAHPARGGEVLAPYRAVEVARLMADWLARLRAARSLAHEWFARHGVAAVPLLVPDALGGPGQGRRSAEGALLLLAADLGADAVVKATAAEYGDDAAAVIGALLAADPLDRLPARVPKPGAWADPALLPQVLLRDRPLALPASATRHVITMLAMSEPGDEYAGLAVVRGLCDPASLAEFGRALFGRWLGADCPSKDGWALTQLALTGDDETVRVLAPQIRAWPGEGGHKRAVAGLDVLAAIGTDLALTHLHGIAQKVKFKALRARAQEKITEVAETLGLTAERLADRLVPDFGLDANSGLVLDYGPRRFTVGFDEQLKPYVLDEDGKLRKDLPKPGAKDDQDLATASYKRFAALKKDVRAVAADQIRRLESAMVRRRRWTAAEFQELLVAHPLAWHLVRRLVWLAWEGERGTPFRIAEDRTFADVDDDAFTIPADAEIGIAHPLDLGEGVKAWGELFADYEILQPFPQLGRPVHTLTEQERADTRLARFEGVTVPTGAVLGLEGRGWRRGAPQDGGWQGWISRDLPGGRRLVIDLDPGIIVGYIEEEPEQRIGGVVLATGDPDLPSREDPPPFGVLDPVTASEVLDELTALTGTAR